MAHYVVIISTGRQTTLLWIYSLIGKYYYHKYTELPTENKWQKVKFDESAHETSCLTNLLHSQ